MTTEGKHPAIERELLDFVWNNCRHGKGRPVAYWLICRECVVAFIERRATKKEPRRLPETGDPRANDAAALRTADAYFDANDQLLAEYIRKTDSESHDPKGGAA